MSRPEKRFAISGSAVSMVSFVPDSLVERIPPAIYTLDFNPMGGGFFLVRLQDKFEMPTELFGDLRSRSDLLFRRYTANGEVSALLTGAKGAGKSLLAHHFANRCIDQNRAVIIVDRFFDMAPALMAFLQSLGNQVFIFDEFAKKAGEHQEGMLDFFSGTYAGDRATFVIENSQHKINEFMLDRPGRVRWNFRYGKLPMNVVKEVCEHYELPEAMARNVCEYSARVTNLSMNTLKTLIQEVLFEGQSMADPKEFRALTDILNIPKSYSLERVPLKATYKGVDYEVEGCNIYVGGRDANMTFQDMEHHPLTKALIADNNEFFLQCMEEETYEDDNEKEVVDWSDIRIHFAKPVYAVDGNQTIHDKHSGVTLTVGVRYDEDDFSFDAL